MALFGIVVLAVTMVVLVFSVILMLTIGLPACGKYGPPVRTVVPKKKDRAASQTTEAQQQVPEEKIPAPVEFDDARDDQEMIP
jgi:hypothetical protein